MIINITFDPSVGNAPAGFKDIIATAIQYFENTFINPVTINIDVGYGEVAGQKLAANDLGESEANYVSESYSAVANALVAENAVGASTLPTTSPFSGTLSVSQAEVKALNLPVAANASTIDGYIGFSAAPNIFSYSASLTPPAGEYYFLGVVEHEISEDLGRVSLLDGQPFVYSPMDLFRYLAPGMRDLNTGQSGDTAYFSIDTGTTNLGTWNNYPANGDLGDWYPSGPAPNGLDAYNDFGSAGVINAISASDVTSMNVLGWISSTSTAPKISAIVEAPSSGTLNAGKAVTITLEMDVAATVAGSPTLTLSDGGTATYSGGTGTSALTFSYTVGVNDVNVSSLAVNTVNLNGGTIQDSNGNAANLSLLGLSQTGPQIDTSIPAVSTVVASPADGDLNAGKTVTITLDLTEAVTVAGGLPTLTLNDQGVAAYEGGSGTNDLEFLYTIAAGQNTPDLTVVSVDLNGATITDHADNLADLTGALTSPTGTLQIDTTPPTVSSIVSSQTGEVDAGQTTHIILTMSEPVLTNLAGGPPTLTLNDGAIATYDAGASLPSSGILAFDYKIGSTDYSANVEATSVNLPNRTTIVDNAGNTAGFSGALDIGTGLQVGTTLHIVDGYIQAVEQHTPLMNEDTNYVEEIGNGTDTFIGVLHQIVNSTTTSTGVIPVVLLYNAVFDRVPDAAGLQFWTSAYTTYLQTTAETPDAPINEAMVALAGQFVTSPEFAVRFGGADPSTVTYTTLLYTNILNRPPDQSGLAFWEGVLNTFEASGADHDTARAILLEQFVDSQEYVTGASPHARGFLEQSALGIESFTGTIWQQSTDTSVETAQSVAIIGTHDSPQAVM